MFNLTFEKEYSEYTDTPLQAIVEARLGGDSYAIPKISSAYVWWLMGHKSGHAQGVDDELERQFCGEE